MTTDDTAWQVLYTPRADLISATHVLCEPAPVAATTHDDSG